MLFFRVKDQDGVDVTDKWDWYIDKYGCLYFLTDDIDYPLIEAAGYSYKIVDESEYKV